MKNKIKGAMRRFSKALVAECSPDLECSLGNESVAQKTLMQQYRLLARQGVEALPDFRDVGFRKSSQFEEDGMLRYLFSLIAPLNPLTSSGPKTGSRS